MFTTFIVQDVDYLCLAVFEKMVLVSYLSMCSMMCSENDGHITYCYLRR